jgi:hypothetical protein
VLEFVLESVLEDAAELPVVDAVACGASSELICINCSSWL